MSTYGRVADPAEIPHRIDELGARTIIVDVEPLVAFWNTGQPALQAGVAGLLDQVTAATAVQAIIFANSTRTLPASPQCHGLKGLSDAVYRLLVITLGGFRWPAGCCAGFRRDGRGSC